MRSRWPGGYTKLGKLHKINGQSADAAHVVRYTGSGRYDQEKFGFLHVEVSKTQIVGTYLAAVYDNEQPPPDIVGQIPVDLSAHKVY